MNICEHLAATARIFPEKDAIAFEGQQYTYAELDQMSLNAANLLGNAGIGVGDRVAIMLPNTPSFVVWYYATLRIGAIAVSVSTRWKAHEVSFLAADCGAKAFISDHSGTSANKDGLPSCIAETFVVSDDGIHCNGGSIGDSTIQESTWYDANPNDPALILYTSGTTGVAKGATLSHLNVRSNVAAFNHLCSMRSDDRILLAVPLFHCFGQNALLNSGFNVGATIVLQRKFDPHDSARSIEQESVSQLYGVPTMFRLLHECCQPKQLATVRYCFSAAATLPVQVSQRWHEKFGMPIYEGYGLTETSPFASYNHRNRYQIGSIGTPIDCVEMKILDTESHEACRPGVLGEIVIRGPNVMLGYWNRPEDTAKAIKKGWFHSGDIGRVDDQGYFYIVDRVKDMIDVGGSNVYPAEVERVLLDHPDIAETAVVGFPDMVFGEQVVAFVVLADNTADLVNVGKQIRQFAQSRLANYKTPAKVIVLDELPRNASGKVLKTKLREYDIAEDHDVAPTNSDGTEGESSEAIRSESYRPVLREKLLASYASSRYEIALAYLQETVKSLVGADDLPDPDSRFLDVGLDSLMLVELSRQLQTEIGHDQQIPATLVFDYPRICDLAQFLVAALAEDQDSIVTPASQSVMRADVEEDTSESTVATDSATDHDAVASLSEDEALKALLRELED